MEKKVDYKNHNQEKRRNTRTVAQSEMFYAPCLVKILHLFRLSCFLHWNKAGEELSSPELWLFRLVTWMCQIFLQSVWQIILLRFRCKAVLSSTFDKHKWRAQSRMTAEHPLMQGCWSLQYIHREKNGLSQVIKCKNKRVLFRFREQNHSYHAHIQEEFNW